MWRIKGTDKQFFFLINAIWHKYTTGTPGKIYLA